MKTIGFIFAVMLAMAVFSSVSQAQTANAIKNSSAYANNQKDTVVAPSGTSSFRGISFVFSADTCSGSVFTDYRTKGKTTWTVLDTTAFSGNGSTIIEHVLRDNTKEILPGFWTELRYRVSFAASANTTSGKKYSVIQYTTR